MGIFFILKIAPIIVKSTNLGAKTLFSPISGSTISKNSNSSWRPALLVYNSNKKTLLQTIVTIVTSLTRFTLKNTYLLNNFKKFFELNFFLIYL